MLNKILTFVLSALIMVQTILPGMLGAGNGKAEPDLQNAAEYMEYVKEYGAPALDTATFLRVLSPLDAARRLATGRIFAEPEETRVNVEMDSDLTQFTSYIAANTGLDIEKLLKVTPDFSTPIGDLLSAGLDLDTTAMRQAIYTVADRAREEGYTSLATMMYVFAMFFTVAKDVRIYGVPREENPDELEVFLDVTYRDGSFETINPDIVVDTRTGRAYNLNGTGLAGSGFEMNVYELTLYTVVNSWQRKFGFNRAYDVISDIVPAFVYETRRFEFEYGGKEWMVQIWKGNYALVTNGAEIGVYNREPGAKTYKAVEDDEMLTLSLALYHAGTKMLSRGPEKNWWLTGFKLSSTIYLPESLTMEFSVKTKDNAMRDALVEAIENEAAHDVTYVVEGKTVIGKW